MPSRANVRSLANIAHSRLRISDFGFRIGRIGFGTVFQSEIRNPKSQMERQLSRFSISTGFGFLIRLTITRMPLAISGAEMTKQHIRQAPGGR